MIETWPVGRVMQAIDWSSDFGRLETDEDWRGMISWKIGDPQVPALIEAIERDGFTDPITLMPNTNGAYTVGNGHHRLATAVLMGIDEILIEKDDEIFSPHNGYELQDKLSGSPLYGNGDHNWLATQVQLDVDGKWLPVSEPGEYHSDADEPYVDSWSESESSESSEPSSDDERTQPYGTWMTFGRFANVNEAYVTDHDLMIHTQQAVIIVPDPNQLALF